MTPSPNRKFLNEVMLPKFASLLSVPCKLAEIGKSQSWDYKKFFQQYFVDNFTHYTIDVNPNAKPDLVFNVENPPIEFIGKFDAVICNGVTEQADNPFALVNGIYDLLKYNGLALFGIVSINYPPYSCDKTRFTKQGGDNLLNSFQILESHIVGEEKNPEYLFYICKKQLKN